MKRFARTREVVTVVAVPLACYAAMKGEEWLATLQIPGWLHVVLVVAVIVLAFGVIRQAGVWLLGFRRVRGWILGRQSIEGTWMDVVRRNEEVVNVGVLHFEVRGYALHVFGKNYATDGTVQNAFDSRTVDWEWPTLEFSFRSDQRITGSPTSGGTAELRFAPSDRGLTQSYSGFCRNHNGQRGDCAGWRVKDAATLTARKTPSSARAVILKVVRGEAAVSPGRMGDGTDEHAGNREPLPAPS